MVAEGAGRERPRVREDRETPRRIVGLGEFIGVEHSSRKRGAAVGELRDAKRAVDRLSARRLAGGDALEGGGEDEAKRRPLVRRAENAHATRQSAPSQDVSRMGPNSRLREQVPDLALGPSMNRAPVVNGAGEGGRAMWL